MQVFWVIATILKTLQDATPIIGGLFPFLGIFDPLNLVDGLGLLFFNN